MNTSNSRRVFESHVIFSFAAMLGDFLLKKAQCTLVCMSIFEAKDCQEMEIFCSPGIAA